MVLSPFQTLAISLKGKDSKGLDVTETRGLAMILSTKQKIDIYHAAKKKDANIQRDGYLVRKRPPTGKNRNQPMRSHVWRDGDTVCMMASTGGLNMNNYAWAQFSADEVCVNCMTILSDVGKRSREMDREYRGINT